MWEVYNEGRLPYENRTNAEVVESLNTGLRLLKPRLAPDAVHLLMEWCWKEVGTGSERIPSRIHTDSKPPVIMLLFSCSQKAEDRPSFALLLHELASLSDLWRYDMKVIRIAIFILFIDLFTMDCQMSVKLFQLRWLQNTSRFQIPGICTLSVPYLQVYIKVLNIL